VSAQGILTWFKILVCRYSTIDDANQSFAVGCNSELRVGFTVLRYGRSKYILRSCGSIGEDSRFLQRYFFAQ